MNLHYQYNGEDQLFKINQFIIKLKRIKLN